MAEGEMTAAQFISSAFHPRIAVMASPEAEAICMKNNLTLVELLQPFSKLESEVHYRDPLGNQVSVRGLHLQFDDLTTSCAGSGSAAAAAVAARQLSDVVRDCCPPPDQWSNKSHSPTPWFQQWRAKLLQVLPPGEHEFHRRFIGCVLAAAVDNCAAAVDQLQRLQQQQRQLQHGTAGGTPTAAVAAAGGSCQGSWFASNTLIYYLVLSDASTDCDWSTAFDRVSSSFGAHCCHHLAINSRPGQQQLPTSEPVHQPDPWLPHLQPRTTLADTLTPAPQSGTDTPAEMAELVSLPSLITEGETLNEHPLSSSSSAATRAASPDLQLQLASTAAAAGRGLNDSTLSLPDAIPRSESAPQILLVNRVVYPSLPSTAGSTLVTSQHHHSQLHGQCLDDADLARIRRFVSDFTVQCLLPHVERLMRSLSDVVNNRKGVSRSLLSATKRWFGGNKPTSSNNAALLNTVIYSQEAPEIQVRRLGDLAFMFGHYDLAYQAFHTAKRDFNADMAWVHFAGAVEMAALSAFLHSTAAKTFPQHYLDQAITTYLDTCRVPNYALRATLFSTECLKSRGQYSEAALQCIRLTSEHNDLRSALLLEQAAHCFLNSRSMALRKYAFHMVLAGHRFSKAAQRRHSIRCYRQAFQVYEGHGWRLAEDHIQFTLARHSLALQEYDAALSALGWLLEAAAAAQGRQSAAQQATFLKEFLQVHRRCDNTSPHGPVLPLPVIHSQRTAILVTSQSELVGDGDWRPVTGVSFDDDRQLEPSWYRLEDLCRERLGISTPTFRPTLQCMNANTSNTQNPRVDVGERVLVRLELENPLAVCLCLADVRLLYQFKAAASENNSAATYSTVSHPEDGAALCSPVSFQTIKHCSLAANSSLQLTLSVCASAAGTLTVSGLHYSLSLQEDDLENSEEKDCSVLPVDSSLPGHQLITVRGPRLNGTAEERRSRVYAADKRLQIVVVERSCRLRACVSQLPDRLLAGQLQQLQLRVDSCGQLPVRRLLLATPSQQLISFQESSRVQQWISSDALVCQLPVSADDASGRLGEWRLWLHAPPTAGQLTIQLLLIGWNGEVGGAYSLLRHTARIQVVSSIDASVTAVRAATALVRLDVRMSCDAAAIYSAIRLCQVSLASPRWSLMQPSKISQVSGVCVERGSTVCLGYTAERLDETAADNHHVSHILLPDESAGTDAVGEAATAFISRHRQLLTAEAAAARSSPAGGRPVPSSAQSEKAEQERNCAALMSTAVSVDASLVLHWQAVSTPAGQLDVVCGQHHLPVQQLDVISATYNLPGLRTQRQPVVFRSATPTGVQSRPDWWPGDDVIDRLVSLQLRHRRRVAHDFQRQRLCVVPVKALVVNHSSCDLIVHLTAKTFNRRLDDVDTGCRSLPSEVLWLGRTRLLLTVSARGQMQVALSAAVTRPGLYSLGSVEVSCRRSTGTDAELTVQRTRSQALLVVTDVTDAGVTDLGVGH